MKVRVEFTIDINVEAWDAAYGTGTDREVVRRDVKEHLEHNARQSIETGEELVNHS